MKTAPWKSKSAVAEVLGTIIEETGRTTAGGHSLHHRIFRLCGASKPIDPNKAAAEV
jgi:hypothetical protein